ncbi:MAG: hypothetical protein K6G06_07400 [Butyrivibrio sp.]|nr:hypothetical protein [Butyrivibrio sp.]
MNIYLCTGDETLQDALKRINENDSEGRVFVLDEEKDRCYIGDDAFKNAPVLVMKQNQYYALREA